MVVDVVEERMIVPMEAPRLAKTVKVREILRIEPGVRESGERKADSPVEEGVRYELHEVGEGDGVMQFQEKDL
eukprot:530525-Amorphochlora_amoeboformis.AAC.2